MSAAAIAEACDSLDESWHAVTCGQESTQLEATLPFRTSVQLRLHSLSIILELEWTIHQVTECRELPMQMSAAATACQSLAYGECLLQGEA